MVQKIIFTETIIYNRSSLGILLILHLMVLANLYFQDIRSTQTLIFSPNSLFHFLYHSQQFRKGPLFVSMSVKQNFFVSVFIHKCLMVLNDVEYTIIKMFVTQMSNYLFVISFQLMFYKTSRCSLVYKKLVHKWHVYYHGCQGRKLQRKSFHKEKDR